MNLKEVKAMYNSGELHKEQVDYLMERIDEAEKVINRVVMVAGTAKSRHLPKNREMMTIEGIAVDYLNKYKEIV